jgi:hypothetical protein
MWGDLTTVKFGRNEHEKGAEKAVRMPWGSSSDGVLPSCLIGT